MRSLWDRHPELPYQAVAPWPVVQVDNNYIDWATSVLCVESWLEQYVGRHWVEWTWSMWSLHQADLCGVRFLHERDVVLFLLRFR